MCSSESPEPSLDLPLLKYNTVNDLKFQPFSLSLHNKKMLVFSTEISKMLVGITNSGDTDQTASSEAV